MAKRNPTFDLAPLQQALSSNRKLQAVLLTELERVATCKASNRAKAATYTRQLAAQAAAAASLTSHAAGSAAATVDSKQKWNRRFFVDPKGDEPAPNADTVKRRAMEQDSFFSHIHPPWSQKESKELLAAVVATQEASSVAASNDHNEDSLATATTTPQHANDASMHSVIDFTQVAVVLHENSNRKAGTALPRTTEECQIHHTQLLQTKRKFSKPELQKLSELVADAPATDAESPVDWDAIANSLSNTECQRTAWDCLVAYHTKLNAQVKTRQKQLQTTTATWTLAEDELLLKYLSAAGPQIVIDSKNSLVQHTILNQLLITKSKKQIFNRANQSLLNPNLKRSEWSDEEERRLAIFMKIYHSDHESTQDVFLASTHCYGRGTKSVVDKWHRSINPEYSNLPFSPTEDEALLQVMRAVDPVGWTELSQKHFPDRHPQRLMNRWSELASDQDILDRERALLQVAVVADSGPTLARKKRPPKKRRRLDVDDDADTMLPMV